MTETAPRNSPGLDLGRALAWLADQGVVIEEPVRMAPLIGGRSNLTYRLIGADGRSLVLRRPPLSGALPSAHDMGREVRLLRAMRGTAVPVPEVLATTADERVLGAAFYVMQFVDGLVIRGRADAERDLRPASRRNAALQLVRTLVDLHGVEPSAVGLGDLGPGVDFVSRQLKRWLRQWEIGGGLACETTVRGLHRELGRRVPTQRRVTLVHGDYRLDNLVIGRGGEVRAVLDWELATLGDPLVDLGLTVAYWSNVQGEIGAMESQPADASGFPQADELVSAYRDHSGADVSEVDFFVAFGYWRNAIILLNVHQRYRSGAYPAADMGVRTLPARAESCLRLAEVALDRWSHEDRGGSP